MLPCPTALAIALGAVALSTRAAAQVPFVRTLLGGNGYERVQGVAVDAQGHVYVAGHTNSTNLASMFTGVAGGYDTTANGGLDGFVAEFSSDLHTLLHWTLFGGSAEDRAYQVEIAPNGQVVVVGLTGSNNFPRTGGAPLRGGWDAFVSRFSADLSQLQVSTLLGGSADENPRGSFALDSAGNVYIGGETASFDFPVTPGVVQSVHAPALPDAWDAFVAKLSPAGQTVWATFLGGSLNDTAHSGLRLAPDGSVVVAGMTNSPDFPSTPGAFQPVFGGHGSTVDPYIGDGFVARLTSDGTQLVFSTFLGGTETDAVAANDSLELDAQGNPVVIGQTRSTDFPIVGAVYEDQYQGGSSGLYDAFVARLSLDGAHLLASTYLGGSLSEEPSGLVIGPRGELFIGGNTHSSDFPTTLDANQQMYRGGTTDAFVVELSSELRYLVYSSYIGGSGTIGQGDRVRGLTPMPNGDLVVGGDTDSADFIVTPGTYDTTFGGGLGDGFLGVERLSANLTLGVSKVNSLGLGPAFRMSGSTSAAAADLHLQVLNAVPSQAGFLAYGNYLVALPYQGGTRYMGPPVVRALRLDLDAAGTAACDLAITPEMIGATRIYQYWYRDPAHPDGTRAGLTNALKLTFLP